MRDKIKDPLPGEDLIDQGLKDLSKNIFSIAALLVLIGAPRLARLGVTIPSSKHSPVSPEHALYEQLEIENPRSAHSRYNSLIRRLVSFERALEKIDAD